MLVGKPDSAKKRSIQVKPSASSIVQWWKLFVPTSSNAAIFQMAVLIVETIWSHMVIFQLSKIVATRV